MERGTLVRLTGMIAGRLWLVALVSGAVGGGLVWLGVRLGPALATLAILIVPPAVVSTTAWLALRPATVLPRWLSGIGAAGTVAGTGWLLIAPGHVPAILILAVGVWLLVVGLISAVAVGAMR